MSDKPYIDPEIRKKVEKFLNSSQKSMVDTLGIEFTSFKPEEIKATMPVSENTIQPFGILHGGASVALAETLSSVGAWLHIRDDAKTAVGVEINANHIRPVRLGSRVKAISAPQHKGRNIQVWETKITTDDEKLVCVSRCTLAIVDSSK